MIDKKSTDERGEQRFRVADGREFGVMIAPTDGEEALTGFAMAAVTAIQATIQTQPDPSSPDGPPTRIRARLFDISRTGAKLLVPVGCCAEGPAKLNLRSVYVNLKVALNVRISWVDRIDDKVARIGCEFTDPLPDHVIPRLAAAAYLERRKEPARGSGLRANARQQLAGGNDISVVFEDISSGGFHLISDHPLNIGERLLLEVTGASGQPDQITAITQWQIADGNLFLVGCSFLTAETAERLQQLARTVGPAGSDSLTRPSAWGAAGRDSDDARCSEPRNASEADSLSDHNEIPSRPDKSEIYPRQIQRVVALTATYRVEGTLHYMHDTRLSDYMNSETVTNQRYLRLSDVEVTHLQSGQRILRTSFIMVAHSQITSITPSELIETGGALECRANSALVSFGSENLNKTSELAALAQTSK